MTTKQTRYIIQKLTDAGVEFESGLTDEDISMAQSKFDIVFPPDLKSFLQTALPVSKDFINWRLGLTSKDNEKIILSMLNWPLEGLIFDLQSNDFWVDSWGEKPDTYDDKILIATKRYPTYPKLIPIYSHRYMSSAPCETGNPVFSVYQTDIIYYGYDLATYFANEFHFALSDDFEHLDFPKREIEFWSDLAG